MRNEAPADMEAGFQSVHPDAGFNFTINRLARSIPVDELRQVATRIGNMDEWITEMRAAGEAAEAEGRAVVAARFYQGAEFYMAEGDDGKAELYRRSLELLNGAIPEMAEGRDRVPFEGGYLPVIRIPARGEERDRILIHSGFDGLIEEMYPMLPAFAEAGYTVIAFEGPGQGAALREHGLHMPFDWERPVGAVLDHYDVGDCTLIGMSLGGYLAPRAAAFEKRIRRLVAWGAMFDFYDVFRQRMGDEGFASFTRLLDEGAADVVNGFVAEVAKTEDMMRWATNHGMHVSGAPTPFDYFQWVRTLNLRDCAHLIDQDVLILMGSKDHLVPPEQLYVQAAAMTGASSVTTIMFTEADGGEQHCQVGNTLLAVRRILAWLDGLSERER